MRAGRSRRIGPVRAVGSEVLGDQHDLAHVELVHLRHDRSIERLTLRPRNDGIAQNPQRLSHPSATLT